MKKETQSEFSLSAILGDKIPITDIETLRGMQAIRLRLLMAELSFRAELGL